MCSLNRVITRAPKITNYYVNFTCTASKHNQIWSPQIEFTRKKHTQVWSPQTDLVIYKKRSVEFLKTKISSAVSWYEEFSGLNEVRKAQRCVVEATQLMKESQEYRRDARLPLAEVQKKLEEVTQELKNIERHDDRYIKLVGEEHKLVKEAKVLKEVLEDADKEERAAFEHLSTCLRMSHETERTQAEKTKYWSLIASILGTVIGVTGSSIANHYKMQELRDLVNKSSGKELLDQINAIQEDQQARTQQDSDYISKIYQHMTAENKNVSPQSGSEQLDRIQTLLEEQREGFNRFSEHISNMNKLLLSGSIAEGSVANRTYRILESGGRAVAQYDGVSVAVTVSLVAVCYVVCRFVFG